MTTLSPFNPGAGISRAARDIGALIEDKLRDLLIAARASAMAHDIDMAEASAAISLALHKAAADALVLHHTVDGGAPIHREDFVSQADTIVDFIQDRLVVYRRRQ